MVDESLDVETLAEFWKAWQSGVYSKTRLADAFGISRKQAETILDGESGL